MSSLSSGDPIAEFQEWFHEAKKTALKDPNAMALATLGADGTPQVRVVLMKEFDARGLVFFTNTTSSKGQDLLKHPKASVAFFWETTRKQVRVVGNVVPVSSSEADVYFASRPRDSQLGAWASLQSQPMSERAEFEQRLAQVTDKYRDLEVPRPPHWSGYRILPESIEFWIEKPFRLHDRYIYRKTAEGWQKTLLYP